MQRKKMNKYTIRKASANDLQLSYDIRKNALGEYVKQTWGWNEEWQWDFHVKDFNPEIMFIVECGGKTAGMLEEEIFDDHILISGLYIMNSFQSKGIGRDLMDKVISFARLHHKPVKLQVLKVNDRAKEFYLRLGFRVYERTDTHNKMVLDLK